MPTKNKPSRKLIAAIVCTYNRYDVLAEALASLNEQSLPSSAYEIIVIDNSSDTERQRRFSGNDRIVAIR